MQQEREYTLDDARACLQEVWGYPSFRPGQEETIEAVLQGRDVLAILPTGGGKSICYYVPTLLAEGLTLVISPLIALMEDQVSHLRARGIPAAFINSTLSPPKADQVWTNAEFGQYRFLYVAPERLETDVFHARAARLPVTLLAVDEAHCVSEWGHHFRPSYMQIAEARRRLDDPPMIALTATATPQVRREIVEHLELRCPKVIIKGFDRPNIIWSIFRIENKRSKLVEIVTSVGGSGIVYAATRRGAELGAAWLEQEGVAAAAYHAGLKKERRARVQEQWIQGKQRVMVATNAFGMGIDKPDVRFVVHYDLPGSLEAYYQEAGRAGRDGKRAYAVLLFRPGDESTQRALIESAHPDAAQVQAVYDSVCNLGQIPIGSLPDEAVMVNVERVSELTTLMPSAVKTAIDVLEQKEIWQHVPLRRHHGVLRFQHGPKRVLGYAREQSNSRLRAFIEAILRAVHAEAFRDWWDVDLRFLQDRTGLTRQRLLRGLTFLSERGLLDWRGQDEALRLHFLEPRSRRLVVDDKAIKRDCRRALARLDDMLRYARSVTCRRKLLLGYFGEASPSSCGRCDICLGRHEQVVITPADEPTLRRMLECIGDGTFEENRSDGRFDIPRDRLDGLLGWLVQEQYVKVENPLNDEISLTEKAWLWLEGW